VKKLVYSSYVILVGLAQGCISLPKQAFDKRANASLKSIAVLEVPPPSELRVVNAGGIGSAFGLVGALVDEAEEDRKSQEFTDLLEERRLVFGRRMTDAVTPYLQRIGYSVTLLANQRPVIKNMEDGDADYSGIPTEADAILDISFSQVGYMAIGTDYEPWMRVSARFFASRSKKRLCAQEFLYGPQLAYLGGDIELVPPNPKYVYGTFDVLTAKANEACGELEAGIGLVANRIATQLR
jgi:hypothetical protein